MGSPKIDAVQVDAWLRTLYGNARGYLHIASSGNWAGRFFDLRQGFYPPTRYVDQLQRADAIGIYARITTVTAPPDDRRQRGSAALAASLPALWADVDIAGPGHRHTPCPGGDQCRHGPFLHPREILPLPPSEDMARAIVAATGLPKPTAWIHSGGGLYPIWRILPVHHITNDLNDVQDLSTRWQRVIAQSAQDHGYHYGAGVGDLARVLRLPGTWNQKTAIVQPCRVVSYTHDGHTLDTLRRGLESAEQMFPAPPPTLPVAAYRPTDRPEGDVRPGDDFATRVDWADGLLLGRLGWKPVLRRGNYREWLRNDASSGSTLSATTGRDGSDNLYVFSTETPFPTGVPITKLEAFRIIHGFSSHKDAVRNLSSRGFGSPPNPVINQPDMAPLEWPAGSTKVRP